MRYREYVLIPQHVSWRFKAMILLMFAAALTINKAWTAVDIGLAKTGVITPEQCAQLARDRNTWDWLGQHCGAPKPVFTSQGQRYMERNAKGIARMQDMLRRHEERAKALR